MNDPYSPSQGLVQDPPDERDYKYSDVVGAAPVEIDWETGFNVFDLNELSPITEDQGRSSSCVAQATAPHMRVWNKKLTGNDVDFSRKFIYSQINLGPGSGAALRDGVKLIANIGDCRETTLHSYENGQPPSEEYMCSQREITQAIRDEAKPFDRFDYRVIPGYTTDINLFAHAIQNNCGVIAGFTGTNAGWTQPIVRAPQVGEEKWGHAVFLSGFGMYQGKKCVFTKNSWGDRYAIQEGPWKGYQAIPEEYFLAAADTAIGSVPGAYVFNAWVLVPKDQTPAPTPNPTPNQSPNQALMDFLSQHEGKLVQDSEQSGAFALVLNGQLLVADQNRVAQLVATYLVRKEGSGMPKDLWNEAPKSQF